MKSNSSSVVNTAVKLPRKNGELQITGLANPGSVEKVIKMVFNDVCVYYYYPLNHIVSTKYNVENKIQIMCKC